MVPDSYLPPGCFWYSVRYVRTYVRVEHNCPQMIHLAYHGALQTLAVYVGVHIHVTVLGLGFAAVGRGLIDKRYLFGGVNVDVLCVEGG